MPKIYCGWDACIWSTEDGLCANPDEIHLEAAKTESDEETLQCTDFDDGEGREDDEGKSND